MRTGHNRACRICRDGSAGQPGLHCRIQGKQGESWGETGMKYTWKMLAALLCSVSGTVGWCYVGGYLVLKGPVREFLAACLAGALTPGRLVAVVLQCFFLLSLAGGVWCVGYMLSTYFKEGGE